MDGIFVQHNAKIEFIDAQAAGLELRFQRCDHRLYMKTMEDLVTMVDETMHTLVADNEIGVSILTRGCSCV